MRHLNAVDLSRRWNLSPRTLERWRWLGQGPHFLKLGGRVVYRVEDVEAFERQHIHAVEPNSTRHHGTYAKPSRPSPLTRLDA